MIPRHFNGLISLKFWFAFNALTGRCGVFVVFLLTRKLGCTFGGWLVSFSLTPKWYFGTIPPEKTSSYQSIFGLTLLLLTV